jgi:hypothetical protein
MQSNRALFYTAAQLLGSLILIFILKAALAHNWAAIQWTLGTIAVALIATYFFNKPRIKQVQGEVGRTMSAYGYAGVGLLVLLAFVLNGVVAAAITLFAAIIMFFLFLKRFGFNWSLGNTFAIGLPMLLAGQLIFETLYVSAI